MADLQSELESLVAKAGELAGKAEGEAHDLALELVDRLKALLEPAPAPEAPAQPESEAPAQEEASAPTAEAEPPEPPVA